MRIVKLEPSQRKRGRWLVWLEDGSLVRLGEGEVASLSLYAGKELTGEEQEALTRASEQGELNERALDLLSLRPMSRRELVDKLTAQRPRRRRPGAPNDPEPDPETREQARERLRVMAERCAERLEELGLIDDRAYARTVCAHYAGKGYGPRKLRDELYRRGVPREYWDEAMDEICSREDGGRELDALLEKKLRGAVPAREDLRRASDFLARRGYGWSEIAEAIERYRDKIGDAWEGSD